MIQSTHDKILITDLLARGCIGVPDEERTRPQDILINLTLYVDTRAAGESDRVEDTVDYSVVTKKVLAAAESCSRRTVEALAADIANLCLRFPSVDGVRVRVEKPHRVRFTRSVGVEIERFR
jgi:FolB domain-containing protein